jgi:hypothetical protein
MCGNAEREVDGLVSDDALIANFDDKGVQVHDAVDRIERPILPGEHVFGDRIGHAADEVRRHLDAIHLLKMSLDVTDTHAAGVKSENAVIEASDATLAFSNELGFKTPLAIARNVDRDFSLLREERLARVAVPPIGGAGGLRLPRFEAQMVGSFQLAALARRAVP